MKKIALMVAAVLAVGQMAQADIAISWSAGNGFYNFDVGGVPADPNDYVNFGGGSVTAYLIYSTDSVADFNSVNAAGQYLANGDFVLTSLVVGANDYAFFDAGTFTPAQPNTLQGGYVYARIIDDSAPGGGSQYYDSATLLTTAWVSPATPQILTVNSSDPLGDQMIQVVPEPTVLAFLGIGAALLGVRRMRRAA